MNGVASLWNSAHLGTRIFPYEQVWSMPKQFWQY
jgi:hypothetical protein